MVDMTLFANHSTNFFPRKIIDFMRGKRDSLHWQLDRASLHDLKFPFNLLQWLVRDALTMAQFFIASLDD